MFEPPGNPWTVPFDGSFAVREAPTAPPPDAPVKSELRKARKALVRELDDLKYRLYAQNRHALLCVFQALDAAGKDSTIRAVFRGVNPASLHVTSFGVPTSVELEHDFLWRTVRHLPERGRVGIFNRSHYGEVLVVRVQPELLEAQNLPPIEDLDAIWEERLESIRDHELHLARNGTVVLKFFLHVSKEEQARRIRRRIENPAKQWKFDMSDIHAREHREDYLDAYEAALNATSRPWAPWHAIPADDKPYMRHAVARTIVETLRAMDPHPPQTIPFGQGERQRLIGLLGE